MTPWVALVLGCTRPAPLPAEVVAAASEVARAVEPARLQQHVEALVAVHAAEEGEVLGGIHGDLPLKHLGSAAYIEQAFRELGLEPVVETVDRSGLVSHNVYVDLPGASSEIVLLSAHHDVWYTAADDNTSGVAIVLETARVLALRPLRRTVRLIAFDLEEPGLYGSRRHHEAHSADPIVAVINMDAMGYADSTPGSQRHPPGLALPDAGDFTMVLANGPGRAHASWTAQLAGALGGVDVHGGVATDDADWPATSAFDSSDHGPAWEHDIPGVFLSDTAWFRNPHYHTEEDLPETLDWAYLGHNGALVAGLTFAFAEVE